MDRIAVLTSGGDAPGMNACIRSIVLTCLHFDIEVLGYRHGYNGLLGQDYRHLEIRHVHNIIQHGGTILHSARCEKFKDEESAQIAADNLNALDIDALLVIGGDGSFRGAAHLAKAWKGQVLGLPGTIDNDIHGTDATIGYYTAIETALDCIDKVRDTADAHERIFLVEVMGKHSGFLGLSAAVASASDQVIVPELGTSPEQELDNLLAHIELVKKRSGHSSYIVVVTENQWPNGISELANIIYQKTQVETRPVILGHVQRGGSPVAQDRLLATKLGAYAVELTLTGESMKMIGEVNQQVVASTLENSWRLKKKLDPYLIKIQQELINPCLE